MAYYKNITYTAPLETLPSFTLLVKRTNDADLQAHARPDGTDIRFFTPDGTALPFEMQSYDGTSGTGIWWVLHSSVSNAENTKICMRYGNSSLSANASTSAVWTDHYAVMHFENGAQNSGPESRQITETGTASYSAGGIIGKSYDKPSGHYFELGTETAGRNWCVSYWFKVSSFSGWGRIFTNAYHYNSYGDNALRYNSNLGGWDLADTNWHHVYFLYEPDIAAMYIDGISRGLCGGRYSGVLNTTMRIGETNENGVSKSENSVGLKLCEFRWFSRTNITSTAARVAYEYNLVKNHDSYVTYSSEMVQSPFYPWISNPVSIF